MRAATAEYRYPVARAGHTSCDRLATGSSQIGVYWMGGIQGVPQSAWVTFKSTRMIRMPSQNEGVARPAMLKARTP